MAALGLAASGSALGKQLEGEATAICLDAAPARTCGASIEAKFDARFSPQRLSRSKWTPLSPWVSMRFKRSDGTNSPSLKEFDIEEDRHLRLNLKGVPVCSRGNADEPPITQRCKKALIGSGEMETYISVPEGVPIVARGEVTVYKAGLRNGVRTLFLATVITIPTPTEIVATVEVKHSSLGRYGLKLVGAVPKVAGGYGSVISLAWRFHKGIYSATCPLDRQLDTRFTSTLVDGTTLAGTVFRNCIPTP